MAYSKRFADDVLEALNDKSQRAVAKKMGTSQTMISNMTSGRIPQDLEIVRRFAEAVGEDPDAWERKARLYGTEVHLRADHKALSDKTIAQILSDIAEEEEKHQNKIPH